MINDAAEPSVYKVELGQLVRELDEKIVNACNELMRMKAYTPRRKVDNGNERTRLKRECEQREALIGERVRRVKVSKGGPLYREACDEVFAQMGMSVPAIVASLQAQLLLYVHLMTILDTQTELLCTHKRLEAHKLEAELNAIQQEQCINENRMLRSVLKLEADMNALKEQLVSCPRRAQSSESSQTPFLRKRQEHSSSSDRTLNTVSSGECSLSLEDDEYNTEFSPKQSPKALSAPGRPSNLVKMSSPQKSRLITAQL